MSATKISTINQLSDEEVHQQFIQCCTASTWAMRMVASRPFADVDNLLQLADQHWQNLSEADYLEAFSGHPKIGDINSLKEKYAHTKTLANNEQAGVDGATDQILQALAEGNHAYEKKFGFIFIVCATGKTAQQMLHLLQQRLPNDRQTELQNAMEEQRKITHIRLEKLL